MTAGPMTLAFNPWQTGSERSDEWRQIEQRLRDPQRERRMARYLDDQARANRGELRMVAPPDEHARQLNATGVLFGPDCSQFQGKPNWSSVAAAGCKIGGYKVSEGYSYTDPSHAYNRDAVQKAGLIPLAYHYLVTTSTPESQAEHYCALADPNAIHALDVEAAASSPGLQVARWVAQWRKHYPHKPLVIYSNRGMWINRSHVSDSWPSGVDVWHAGIGDGFYTSATGALWAEWSAAGSLANSMASLGAPRCLLWQFTDHAVVPGVSGTCDGNGFTGTLDDLRALATGASDDMSQADVDAINAHTDAALAKVGALVHNQQIFADKAAPPDGRDLSFGLALHYIYQAVAGGTVTDAELAGALTSLRAGVVNDIASKLPTVGGGNIDTEAFKAAVGQVFDEHIGRVGLAVEAPAAPQ